MLFNSVCNVLGDATGAAIVQHLCQNDLVPYVSASTDALCEKTCRDSDQGHDHAVAARDANSGIAPGGGENERERERESHPLPVEGLAPEVTRGSILKEGMTPSFPVRFSKVFCREVLFRKYTGALTFERVCRVRL